MEKSLEFYKNVMDLKVVHQTDIWSELELSPKVNLALYKTDKKEISFGFAVDDCKEATEELIAKNVKIIKNCEKREDGLTLTHFEDVDGYVHWLVEPKK